MNKVMATHTPGPWRYEAATKTIRSVPSNYWLATLDSGDGAVDHAANARLIAAAPDYHTAAIDLVARHDAHARKANFESCGCEDCLPLRAAIAKAQGR